VLWHGLLEGRSAVSRITLFDSEGLEVHIAGEIVDGAYESGSPRHVNARLSWLLAALREALADAALEPPQARAGVVVAGGELTVAYAHVLPAIADALVGGALDTRRLQRALSARDGAGLGSAHHSGPAALVAATLGAGGPVLAPSGACASGTLAIGLGAESIAWGDVDICVAGATDSRVEPMVMQQYFRLGALCTDSNDAPERASRPFDVSRSGFVMAEGAGVLVLEALDHALARGARVRAEVVGFGTSLDAYRVTDPEPEGLGATLAMQAALASAGCTPTDVDYVNAHGTSTPANDVAEARAIHRVLGTRAASVPVGAFKANLGHAIQASGALETIGTVRALEEGVLPHTINTKHVDPQVDLDVVMDLPRRGSFRTALKNSFGFGGQNACLVLRRWEG
jgi:3-oxoacyl-(acyl-carrier-protein) synthase